MVTDLQALRARQFRDKHRALRDARDGSDPTGKRNQGELLAAMAEHLHLVTRLLAAASPKQQQERDGGPAAEGGRRSNTAQQGVPKSWDTVKGVHQYAKNYFQKWVAALPPALDLDIAAEAVAGPAGAAVPPLPAPPPPPPSSSASAAAAAATVLEDMVPSSASVPALLSAANAPPPPPRQPTATGTTRTSTTSTSTNEHVEEWLMDMAAAELPAQVRRSQPPPPGVLGSANVGTGPLDGGVAVGGGGKQGKKVAEEEKVMLIITDSIMAGPPLDRTPVKTMMVAMVAMVAWRRIANGWV